MRDVWLTALLKMPPVILDRRLQPFSMSHAVILEAAKNPYWMGGDLTGPALVEAVDICSRTWEENQRFYDSPLKARLRQLRRFALRAFTRHKISASDDFLAYIQDYSASTTREDMGGGRDMVSPWQWRVACHLIERGFSESEAWNMPMNRARCYYDAADEMEGAENLVNEEAASTYELIARANHLVEIGKADEAEPLYAEAQRQFDERRGVKTTVAP